MNRYLIKSDEILFTNGQVKENPDSHIKAFGPYLINELSDTMYNKGETVGYHEHTAGKETFMLVRGSVEVIINGKQCVMKAGDILQLSAYTAHKFTYLEDGTMWRELFQELNMHQALRNKKALEECFPEKFKDEQFLEEYRKNAGTVPLVDPVGEIVSKSEVHEIRTPEFSLYTHKFDGVTLRQKVKRNELNGIKEIWEATFDKGVKISCTEEPDPSSQLISITKGSFEFKVANETFIANETDLVQIPQYTSFEIKALEDDSKYLDLNCQAFLMRLAEELKGIQIRTPEKLQDKKYMKSILLKHKCFMTGYEK